MLLHYTLRYIHNKYFCLTSNSKNILHVANKKPYTLSEMILKAKNVSYIVVLCSHFWHNLIPKLHIAFFCVNFCTLRKQRSDDQIKICSPANSFVLWTVLFAWSTAFRSNAGLAELANIILDTDSGLKFCGNKRW